MGEIGKGPEGKFSEGQIKRFKKSLESAASTQPPQGDGDLSRDEIAAIETAIAEGKVVGHPKAEGETHCGCGGIKPKGGVCPVCKSK